MIFRIFVLMGRAPFVKYRHYAGIGALLQTLPIRRTFSETQSVIDSLLSGHSPLRYLRRAQGIVRLAKTLPASAIEYGCKQASLFGRLRLKYITDCVKRFHKNGARPVLVKSAPSRDPSHLFLHEKM